MPTDQTLDAMRLLLLAEPLDFTQARVQFAANDGSTTELTQLVLVKNETMVVTGALIIHGPLVLSMGAQLWVSGDCTVNGVIYSSGLQYSMLAVGGALRAKLIRSAGEIFALNGLTAETIIGLCHDHSTYASAVHCKTYIASDRVDVIGELKAETRLTEPDAIEHGLALLFPGLYPRLPHENEQAIDRRERAFFTAGLKPPKPAAISDDEAAALRRDLQSSDPAVLREAHHVIRRKHLLSMTGALAASIRQRPEQSAEAVDLLSALGATDVLCSLLDGSVRFGRAASAVSRAFEQAGWVTRAENKGAWVFSVRPDDQSEWRQIPT